MSGTSQPWYGAVLGDVTNLFNTAAHDAINSHFSSTPTGSGGANPSVAAQPSSSSLTPYNPASSYARPTTAAQSGSSGLTTMEIVGGLALLALLVIVVMRR